MIYKTNSLPIVGFVLHISPKFWLKSPSIIVRYSKPNFAIKTDNFCFMIEMVNNMFFGFKTEIFTSTELIQCAITAKL